MVQAPLRTSGGAWQAMASPTEWPPTVAVLFSSEHPRWDDEKAKTHCCASGSRILQRKTGTYSEVVRGAAFNVALVCSLHALPP